MAAPGTDEILLQEQKKQLRGIQKARFSAADPGVLHAENHRITAEVIGSPLFRRAGSVLGYIRHFPEEADPAAILRHAADDGKKVYVPVIRPGEKILRWAAWEKDGIFRAGKYGIPEPDTAQGVETSQMPGPLVCLVPGLAFTEKGFRLGRGGGYYDRFLSHFSGISIGLAFSLSMVKDVPASARDFRVHYVATPQGIIATSI